MKFFERLSNDRYGESISIGIQRISWYVHAGRVKGVFLIFWGSYRQEVDKFTYLHCMKWQYVYVNVDTAVFSLNRFSSKHSTNKIVQSPTVTFHHIKIPHLRSMQRYTPHISKRKISNLIQNFFSKMEIHPQLKRSMDHWECMEF